MGMFDELICQYPLPDDSPDWAGNTHKFQTKSFDNLMELYTITPEGKLIRHCEEREYFEDDSHPFGFGSRVVQEWTEFVEYHGDIVFYTSNVKSRDAEGNCSLINGTGNKPLFVEYKARFTEGQLQWIKPLEKAI